MSAIFQPLDCQAPPDRPKAAKPGHRPVFGFRSVSLSGISATEQLTNARSANPPHHTWWFIRSHMQPHGDDFVRPFLDTDDQARIVAALAVAGLHIGGDVFVTAEDWWTLIAFSVADPGAEHNEYWQRFDLLAPLMSDAEYATTCRQVWVNTNGAPPTDAQRRLIDHGRQITQQMWMTDEDYETFLGLPDEVQVYRVCRANRVRGWSWSLSERAAKHVGGSTGGLESDGAIVIATGVVKKANIIGLFSANWQEDEIVVPGELVCNLTIQGVIDGFADDLFHEL